VIGYCTNIHAEFRPDFWRQVGAPIGLWLPAHAVETADKGLLKEFRVFTMNGFPYGNFHSERVKYEVYEPNWCDPRRARYTLDLARLLCEISCVDVPTISTLPLGWGLQPGEIESAARALVDIAAQMASLERPVRLCLEPEPGCTLESAADVVLFFNGPLDAAARALGIQQEVVRRHLGVCWDTCHHAVISEAPETVAALYDEAGITVGKMQVSSALVLPDPHDPAARARFLAFDEPRYLHQTRDGMSRCDDLSQANALSLDRPWRSHFHVPVDRSSAPPLATTQDETRRALRLSPTRILEVETYTWSVLPDAPSDDDSLIEAIRRELAWTAQNS
jgi:hypothetical protein